MQLHHSSLWFNCWVRSAQCPITHLTQQLGTEVRQMQASKPPAHQMRTLICLAFPWFPLNRGFTWVCVWFCVCVTEKLNVQKYIFHMFKILGMHINLYCILLCIYSGMYCICRCTSKACTDNLIWFTELHNVSFLSCTARPSGLEIILWLVTLKSQWHFPADSICASKRFPFQITVELL